MTDDIDALRRRLRGRKPGLLGATRAYAVLCPLLDAPGGLELLYEVRAAGIRQAGEVCFPGGRMEPGETPLECALRETEEELSIPRACVTPLGELDFLCNQRGFLLHPVAGYVSAEGLRHLQASPAEVSETFTVPVSYLRGTPPERYAYDLIPRPPDDFPY
ncbi:MAG: CoA pyrophosphatase, partial [Oscillibacter sp.]|nr:CoA pyrophosphatase [Oscillibacter sp.]